MRRRALTAFCLAWALLGLSIAAYAVGAVNNDARLLVTAATCVGVGAALLAARCSASGSLRWAGLCLVVSIVIPTFGAAALNLVPLAVGLVLLVRGPAATERRPTAADAR